MKTLVLCIDALEYEWVNQWNVQAFKQKEYGKVKHDPKQDYGSLNDPYTGILWANFITGTTPEHHGITVGNRYQNPLLAWFQTNIWRPLGLTGKTGIGNILKPIFKYDTTTKKDLKTTTIFDELDNSIGINLPSYNESQSNKDLRNHCIEYLEGTITGKQLEQHLHHNLIDTLNATSQALKTHDTVIVHIFPLDIAGHAYHDHPEKIKQWYLLVAREAEKLEQQADWTLIISDHGMKDGEHTRYAFYSTSKPLGLDQPRLSDFKEIIKAHQPTALQTTSSLTQNIRENGGKDDAKTSA